MARRTSLSAKGLQAISFSLFLLGRWVGDVGSSGHRRLIKKEIKMLLIRFGVFMNAFGIGQDHNIFGLGREHLPIFGRNSHSRNRPRARAVRFQIERIRGLPSDISIDVRYGSRCVGPGNNLKMSKFRRLKMLGLDLL